MTSFASLAVTKRESVRDPHRQSLEALREDAVVLADQERRRRQECHLLAGQGGDEGGTQRHLGLAEADIAAQQAVHRPARAHVLEHGLDRGQLVLGLLVGEARGELLVDAVRQVEDGTLAHRPLGRDLDQLARELADALLDLGLARLPADPAQLVERGILVGMAVARQHVEVLDRHEQLVAALVEQLQAVVRRVRDLEGLQAREAADAVLGMDDEIALRQRGDVLDELVRGLARTPRRRGQAVAQQVALADDVDRRRPEAALDRQDGDGGGRDLGHLRPALDSGQPIEPVVRQDLAQPLGRALAVGGDQRPFARRHQLVEIAHDRIEQVDRPVGALGREVARGSATQILDPRDPGRRPRRRAEMREFEPGAAGELALDPTLVEIEQLGRQRTVGCGAEAGAGRDRCEPRFVVLADQCCTRLDGVARQMVERDLGLGVEIGGERHEIRVEQRQPVLHAREHPAGLDRLQERVGGDRAEAAQIARLERFDGIGVEQDLAHRHELERRDLALRALGQGIEAADRFQRRAEEVQPHRLLVPAGKDVDQPATHGVVAGLHHGTGAVVAVALEVGHQRVPVHPRTGLGAQVRRAHPRRRRHLLHDGVGRGQDQPLGAAWPGRELPQGAQALGHDARTGRDPVVGQAVPGRNLDDLDLGREERDH